MFVSLFDWHAWLLLHDWDWNRLWTLQHRFGFNGAVSERSSLVIHFWICAELTFDWVLSSIKFEERENKSKQSFDLLFDAHKHTLWMVWERRKHRHSCEFSSSRSWSKGLMFKLLLSKRWHGILHDNQRNQNWKEEGPTFTYQTLWGFFWKL